MTQAVMNLDRNHLDQESLEQKETVARFEAALGALEAHLARVLSGGDEGVDLQEAALAAMQEQVRFLTEERDQLLADLEAERDRVRRLKAANDEVCDRLETMTGTLKSMFPVSAS